MLWSCCGPVKDEAAAADADADVKQIDDAPTIAPQATVLARKDDDEAPKVPTPKIEIRTSDLDHRMSDQNIGGPTSPYDEQMKKSHRTIQKLRDLDVSTKIPFLLVELRGEGHKQGHIEICGKDEYGVYTALHDFLTTQWGCTLLEKGAEQAEPEEECVEIPLPFAERTYSWNGFLCMQKVTARQCDGHPDVVVRKTPSGKAVSKMPNGTVLNVCSESDGSLLVQNEKYKGWVKKTNLQYDQDDDCEGTSSMGLNTMKLIDFMCNKQGWTLGVINSGNVGWNGETREQQVIFKAPHPMNLVVPHIMIELRSVGYIEVCGGGGTKILDQFEKYAQKELKATRLSNRDAFCDRFYKCGKGVFQESGKKGANNVGLLSTKICDFVGKGRPWSLVTMAGSDYGESGNHREQQLVFRLDHNPLGEEPHLLVELREAGFVEVCGIDTDGIHKKLDTWLKHEPWCCTEVKLSKDKDKNFCDKKYKWPVSTKDMMHATAEIIEFFQGVGWSMQICSMGSPEIEGDEDSLEQKIMFRPGGSKQGVVEPHIVMDLYMGDGDEELFQRPDVTQTLTNQYIAVWPVGECGTAIEKINEFIVEYLEGTPDEKHPHRYSIDVFKCRGIMENNLGFWTMRMCDFMVDQLGWSFVVCNVNNLGKYGQLRQQQLIFRYDGEFRDIPQTGESELFSESAKTAYSDFKPPSYWKIPAVLSQDQLQGVVKCEPDELAELQEIFDSTFRRVTTRNRALNIPFRLEVVHAFRSENIPLLDRFEKKVAEKAGHGEKKTEDSPVARTLEAACPLLNGRLGPGEALLFHGTNPSSSLSILKGGFVLDHAGKSSGALFGNGVYLAECCSKSDEYARDDQGGSYPALRSLVLCRTFVGQPFVVTSLGDHAKIAQSKGFDCVLGDRERICNTYREFVVFDEALVIPEYSVIYKRVMTIEEVPKKMQIPVTCGTERCFWQVKLGKGSQANEEGWCNLSQGIGVKLYEALQRKEKTVTITIQGAKYLFDFEGMTRTNVTTGVMVELKQPDQDTWGANTIPRRRSSGLL